VRLLASLEENGIIDMALLGKEQIWAAQDILWEDVPVPEWGGEVRVKGLTGRERDKFESDSLSKAKKGGQRDVMRLGEKSAVALERVFAKAQALSGMTDEDMEELAGNSESDQNGSSTSD
jgi:hypothetical protein